MVTRTGRTDSPAASQKHSRWRAKVLVIEARYYPKIADELLAGAIAEFEAHNASYDRIEVPGALEIPQVLAQAVASGLIPRSADSARYCGVVALGCVIRGETAHFDVVINNANHWLMQIAIEHNVPVGNGILTVENEAQALERARGGRSGKGADAAAACLRLIETSRAFEGQGA